MIVFLYSDKFFIILSHIFVRIKCSIYCSRVYYVYIFFYEKMKIEIFKDTAHSWLRIAEWLHSVLFMRGKSCVSLKSMSFLAVRWDIEFKEESTLFKWLYWCIIRISENQSIAWITCCYSNRGFKLYNVKEDVKEVEDAVVGKPTFRQVQSTLNAWLLILFQTESGFHNSGV